MGRRPISDDLLDRILKMRRTRSIRLTARLLRISTTTVMAYCGRQLAGVLRHWTPPTDPAKRPPPAIVPRYELKSRFCSRPERPGDER